MSVVDSALLTSELRRLRAAANLRQEDVAVALDWSHSKMIRIEGGAVGISTTDLKALLQFYGVTDGLRIEEFVKRARGARARPWWHSYSSIGQEFASYLGYEEGASVIRQFQPLLVPGLLQTEEYARSITRGYLGESRIVDDIVEIRLQRQERVMEREAPPEQIYILDEAVIRRRISRDGVNIMSNQLRHLATIALRPQITIKIISFSAGPHFGMRGPFSLLSFDNELGDILYLESARRGDLTLADSANSSMISEYADAFEELRSIALGPEDSLELIRTHCSRDDGLVV